ncbi:hypothetical protein [Duganella sp. CY15W]|nr:hypothetical protein [Duganella sp. CY15W]
MKPLDIFVLIITAVGMLIGLGAALWIHLDTQKKYPDKKNGR